MGQQLGPAPEGLGQSRKLKGLMARGCSGRGCVLGLGRWAASSPEARAHLGRPTAQRCPPAQTPSKAGASCGLGVTQCVSPGHSLSVHQSIHLSIYPSVIHPSPIHQSITHPSPPSLLGTCTAHSPLLWLPFLPGPCMATATPNTSLPVLSQSLCL